jgi:hypothetical protein
MWQRRMENEIFQPIANVFVHTHEWFKGRRPQVPSTAKRAARTRSRG